MLKLHHWGPVIEGLEPPAAAATLDASSSAAPTAGGVPCAPAPGSEEKTSEAPATATPGGSAAPEDLGGKPDEELGDGSASGEVVKTEAEGTTPVPADTIVAIQPNEPRVQEPYNPYVNMAHLPVLSWQYDELVFNDPPAAFFDILDENPPTPLPAKLRRPRDQREASAPAKKQKGRASTVGTTSRAQTQEPGTDGATGPVAPAGGAAHLPGSADVPLEFAKEMELAELNRLTDVKLYVIDQMDTWR
jgi:YEATS domain-containing protein 4